MTKADMPTQQEIDAAIETLKRYGAVPATPGHDVHRLSAERHDVAVWGERAPQALRAIQLSTVLVENGQSQAGRVAQCDGVGGLVLGMALRHHFNSQTGSGHCTHAGDLHHPITGHAR